VVWERRERTEGRVVEFQEDEEEEDDDEGKEERREVEFVLYVL